MDLQTTFIVFGLCLAALAVLTCLVGLRSKDFPNRNTMVGLLVLGVLLVAGTATYAVKLSVEEQHQREEGELATGEEASVTPVVVPARF
ncbi:MAG: hypothetical protein JJE13_09345 [Thermoleophilia bacterium]|nr:hypothetical protein [Thermoleophilia bacterium]